MNSKYQDVFDFFFEVGIINQLSGRLFAACLEGGLHPSQFAVLRHLLRRGEGKTPLQIADAFQVPKTSMTNSLAVLERRGLIALQPNPDDRRSKLVYMTAEGHDYFLRTVERSQELVAAMETYLDLDHVSALLPELRKIREALDDNRDVTVSFGEEREFDSTR